MLGTRFIGRYKVIEELGRGGMGIVYRGEDPRLERPVAIKVLPPRRTASPKALMRFQREARVCARLDHPYILKIYDYGEEENTYHIVMEYVEGITLRELIGEDADTIDVAEMSRLFAQICQALDYAHSLKITHRDIKPENIMVTAESGWAGSRKVKVMDFGLAVLEEMHDLTDPDAIMGTIAYFSPEQARGEPADHRSDIYSMGVMFYEMLTGQLPFEANNPSDMIRRHLDSPPPSPRLVKPTVSPVLERVVLTCMRKDPADRYQSVRVICEELELYRSQADISAAHFWGATGIAMQAETPRTSETISGTVGTMSGTIVEDEEPPKDPAPAAPRHLVPPTVAHSDAGRPQDWHSVNEGTHAVEGTYDSTSDALQVPPLASPLTPGLPKNLASRLGPPRPLASIPGFAKSNQRADESKPIIPTTGLQPVASKEWLAEAKDRDKKNEASRFERFAALIQKDGALARGGEDAIPTTVCGRCGIENPGDRKYCLDCGGLLDPSQYQASREASSHYDLGVRLLRNGNLQEAKYEFGQALARDANLGEARKNLAVVYLRLGETARAEEEFKIAVTLLADDAEVHRELATLYRQTGRKDEAIAELGEALRIDPRDANVRCLRAFLYSHSGDLARAVDEYRKVLSYADDNLEAHLQLGIIYGSQDMIVDAISEFETVVRLDPHNQSAYQWLGRLYARRNRLGDAERAFQSAINLNPSDAAVHADLGAVYEAQHKGEQALRQLRQAITLDSGNLEARTRLAALYVKQHQPAMAIVELEEVLAFHPMDASLHQQLGELYLKQNQLDKALQHFERTVSLDPASADMHNRLGQVYLKKDYDSLSISEYQKAITLDPYNSDFHEDLGMAYYVNGQRDSAIAEIKKAAILNSKNVDYFKALGILCFEDGRSEEALQFLKRAVELQPRDPHAHALLGRVHHRQGMLNYALLEYQKALEFAPDNQLMLVYLARVYAELGKPDQAVRYFKKAIGQMGGQMETPENRLALARSYQDLGKAYLQAGDNARARVVLESAMTLLPHDARGLHYMGLVHQAQGDMQKALEALSDALQQEPQNADILADLGNVYRLKGDYDMAAKAVRKAIRLSPSRASLYEQLSHLLTAQREFAEASEAVAHALTLEPRRADHYHGLQAGIFMAQGLAQKAAAAYEKGLSANSRNWRLHEGLAHAFEQLGRLDDAIAELEKARALRQGEAESRKLSEEIERLRALTGK